MSNVVKQLSLTVMNARNLMRTIQSSNERQKKTEIRRLRRIRHIFEDKTKDYTDPLEEAQGDYQEGLDEINAKGLDIGELNFEVSKLNRELNKKVEDLNKEIGEKEVEIRLTPDDFSYLKGKWNKCDDFLPSQDVQDFVEEVDQAFESVKELELDELKEE